MPLRGPAEEHECDDGHERTEPEDQARNRRDPGRRPGRTAHDRSGSGQASPRRARPRDLEAIVDQLELDAERRRALADIATRGDRKPAERVSAAVSSAVRSSIMAARAAGMARIDPPGGALAFAAAPRLLGARRVVRRRSRRRPGPGLGRLSRRSMGRHARFEAVGPVHPDRDALRPAGQESAVRHRRGSGTARSRAPSAAVGPVP